MTEAIPSPSPEQEIKHLAEQCATLLREIERLTADKDIQRSQDRNTSYEASIRELEADNERQRQRIADLENLLFGSEGLAMLENKP